MHTTGEDRRGDRGHRGGVANGLPARRGAEGEGESVAAISRTCTDDLARLSPAPSTTSPVRPSRLRTSPTTNQTSSAPTLRMTTTMMTRTTMARSRRRSRRAARPRRRAARPVARTSTQRSASSSKGSRSRGEDNHDSTMRRAQIMTR